jgi:hypothetical protein
VARARFRPDPMVRFPPARIRLPVRLPILDVIFLDACRGLDLDQTPVILREAFQNINSDHHAFV